MTPVPQKGERKLRWRVLARAASLILIGTALGVPLSAFAQKRSNAVVLGVPFEVETESFKCDIKKTEGMSLKRLADCDAAVLVTVPGAGGRKFVRFEMDPADAAISQGVRAELRDMYEAVNGEEVWYRFQSLVPKNFPSGTPHRVVLAQWHERVPEGSPHLRPPLAHRLIDGSFRVTLWDDEVFKSGGGKGDGVLLHQDSVLELGRIHEYVYRVVWGSGTGAGVTGWRRTVHCSLENNTCTSPGWARFIHHQGPIGYGDAVGYYFKIGLYTTHPFTAKMVASHRAYRRGPSAASVQATEKIFGER